MKSKNYFISSLILFFAFSTFFLSACNKEQASAAIPLSYRMLANKTWYLEYAQTTIGSNTSTKTYLGQSTYFINFLNDLTTVDSDGLAGTYTVETANNQLTIHVQARTVSGNAVTYAYTIESIGEKYLILRFVDTNSVTTYYYSTQK
jgi:hypothetical protein